MAKQPSLKTTLATLLTFSLLTNADPSNFSQFFGATTATYSADGTRTAEFTACTNIVNGLPALSKFAPSLSARLESNHVNVVCGACTSLGQSRIDSCCPQASSSACFDSLAAQGNSPATAPAVTATTTGPAGTQATATGTASTDAANPTKSSPAGRVVINNGVVAASLGWTLGVGGWLLSLVV